MHHTTTPLPPLHPPPQSSYQPFTIYYYISSNTPPSIKIVRSLPSPTHPLLTHFSLPPTYTSPPLTYYDHNVVLLRDRWSQNGRSFNRPHQRCWKEHAWPQRQSPDACWTPQERGSTTELCADTRGRERSGQPWLVWIDEYVCAPPP